MKKIWFKFYSADYLLDSKIDALPLEAQAVVVRMWCVLHRDGRISADPREISRLCRVPIEIVQMHMQNIVQMFIKDADGLLYSKRMDEEIERTERISVVRTQAAMASHSKRLPTNAVAKPPAKASAKVVQSESESDIKPQHATKRGTRIPPDFKVTDEHKAFSMKFHLPDPDDFIDEFRDYWIAAPGQKGVKLDWDATFRNWIRNNAKRNGHQKRTSDQLNLTGGLEQVMANRRANGFH